MACFLLIHRLVWAPARFENFYMLASIFDGARGLYEWTLSWFNFGTGSDLIDAGSSPLTLSSSTPGPAIPREAPTPKGSFEQIDRAQVLDDLARWQAIDTPIETEVSDTEMLGVIAAVSKDSGSDADMLLALAFEDSNGLDASDLEALGAVLGETTLFSPVIQPSIDVQLNDAGTAGLISVLGTANASLEDVYLPLTFTLEDQTGAETGFDLTLPVWNTDLI